MRPVTIGPILEALLKRLAICPVRPWYLTLEPLPGGAR